MPIQQITVVPAKETASNGKSATRSKDKNEGKKAPGRSGSRSSNISKASNSTTGLATASRTSITPSSQEICSSGHLTPLEEDDSELHKPGKHKETLEMSVFSSTLGSPAQGQKKQVKRRHRRKKSSSTVLSYTETNDKQEQTDRSDRSPSSDRCETGEKRERAFRNRKELPPRLRYTGAPLSVSTSEDEAQREARSWSKEKARRARHRSESKGGEEKADMELQSLGSDEGKEGAESRPMVEDSGGLKKRHSSSRGSMKRDSHMSSRDGELSREKEKSCRGHKPRSPGDSSSPAQDGEELVARQHQESTSVTSPQKHTSVNGGMLQHCSDDSDLEVCRICHCEGDDDFPLIMPCRCTGSLNFVHQACLNQWIKSSDTRCCELCKFDFVMETKLKPLRKWEKLHMTKSERRKIFCSVLFHLIAIMCMLWSVYILVKRTAEEIRIGKNGGVLEWPFWTKLIVVAIGFTGGLIFMYIQCKVYLQLWRRLKAFNRIITVQNCPEKNLQGSQAQSSVASSKHEAGEAAVGPAPAPALAPEPQMDSDMSVEAAVAPVQNPV